MAYSLVERNIEREYMPAARECGLGITPWSPLAAGFLTGKYARGNAGTRGEGRLSGPNPFGDTLFTDRNWRVLDALRAVAAEVDRPLAQVALAWAAAQPGITSLILGANTVAQLHDNLRSLDVHLTPAQVGMLDAASAPDPGNPYSIFTSDINRSIFGGAVVQGWR